MHATGEGEFWITIGTLIMTLILAYIAVLLYRIVDLLKKITRRGK